VALTVCSPEAAAVGVYTPAADIVPTVAFPLATPSTVQLTLVLVVFVPPAVYVIVCEVVALASRGARVTVVSAGGGGSA
jgi:hypothetical protein